MQSEQKAIEAFTTAKHPADLVNYGERAWCRLETYIFMCLSEMLMRPIHYYAYGKVSSLPCLGAEYNAVPCSRDRSVHSLTLALDVTLHPRPSLHLNEAFLAAAWHKRLSPSGA